MVEFGVVSGRKSREFFSGWSDGDHTLGVHARFATVEYTDPKKGTMEMMKKLRLARTI